MSLKARIVDGGGSELEAKVDSSRALCTIDNPFPPYGVKTGMRVFRQYLTTDGTASSTNDMSVDGSSTNVDYYIPAHEIKDRYISMISFVIADAGQVLNEFANSNAALSNGCRFFYKDQEGEVDIHEALKTNFDFIRLCGGKPSFGDGTGSFRANNISGASEGYIPMLDLRETFGFKWGIKLDAGTDQRLVLRIRDDCTAPDLFDAIAYGFDRVDLGVL